MKGNLFILSGPSGVGKNAVERQLRKIMPNLFKVTTYTTRDPRPGEVRGKSYHFVSDKEFDKMIEENLF